MKKTVKTATLLRNIFDAYSDASMLLETDEFMLFVWLYQEANKNNYGKFPASINMVRAKLRIGRSRQEKITSLFARQEWLTISKEHDEYRVPYRSFYVDINKLADEFILMRLFVPGSQTFNDLLELFQATAESLK